MPILEAHNVIFIHIPKTGGTTVLRMFGLDQVPSKNIFYHIDDTHEYDHASAQLIKSVIPHRYNECYKFTLVRNPYDRLLSEFAWKKKDKDIRSINTDGLEFGDFVTQLYKRFDQIQSQIQKEKSHLIPQSQFVLPDVEIFRFEQIGEALEGLSKKFGVPVVDMKYNQTDHAHFESYYDDGLKGMVYDMYYTDFKLFGYEK